MQAGMDLHHSERRQSRLGLIGLMLGLALGAAALYVLAGPPRLPPSLPSWAGVAATLRGSYLPPEAVAYVLTTAAWAVWVWIIASLILRLVVVSAEAVAHGAAWVRALRAISDRTTLPFVRRLVDGAVITVLIVNILARPTPTAAAPAAAHVVALTPASDGGVSAPSLGEAQSGAEERAIRYTVQGGDTLWKIAERFYGTGFEYGRLVQANAGREMSDGGRFTRAGVIQPGWVLLVPLPSRAVEQVDGDVYYVVEKGDTLRGIAARLLGDEAAWPGIFEANRGRAKLADGRTLSDPDLIWPGLRLRLPIPPECRVPQPTMPAPSARADAPPPTAPMAPPSAPPVAAEPTPVAPSATPDLTPPPEIPTPAATPAGSNPTPLPAVAPDLPEPAVAPTPVDITDSRPVVAAEPAAPPRQEVPPALVYSAAGLAALAAGGGVALLARRRFRRRLTEPPVSTVAEPGPAVSEGFAEAEFARVFAHRAHGEEVEPAVLVADQALRFFDEHGLDGVSVLTVSQRRTTATLTLNAGLAVQPRLLELAADLGALLGGTGRAWRSADHDIVLDLSGVRLAGLVPRTVGRPPRAPMLLPIGVLPSRETLYANWRELGHVLVAGMPGGGTDVVLTSLLGALTARCRPDELRLVTIANRRTLPAGLLGLPHQARSPIEPTDEGAVRIALEDLRAELDRRMRRAERAGTDRLDGEPGLPDLVLVVGELADLADEGTTLELLGVHGPVRGLRLLAASTRPEALGEEVLAHFGTRLVLQTLDEDTSIRLIGRPDAADLGGGGDLLARIDGRTPMRARGFRLSSEHLDQLVGLMRETYGQMGRGMARPIAPSADDLAGDDPPEPEDASGPLTEASPAEEPVASADVSSVGSGSNLGELAPASEAGTAAANRRNGSQGGPVRSAWPEVTVEGGAPAAAAGEASSLIQVTCFGTFRVMSGDRELSPEGEGGAHYKPWEILAYLSAQPEGAVSKEKLLGALWPDVDPQRAAERRTVTLSRLRALLAEQVPGLGADVVRVERNGLCRLDTTQVSSDVHRFVALCRAAPKLPPAEARKAYEEARELYRGDLLTEPFYEWVHARDDGGLTLREQYREECYRATQRLAQLYRREGQADLAVPLYRSLLEAEPTLEDIARSLYRCYQQLGDRRALVREHRRLKDAIRRMFRTVDDPDDDPELYEPEPETVAVYEEVLADLEARAAAGRS